MAKKFQHTEEILRATHLAENSSHAKEQLHAFWEDYAKKLNTPCGNKLLNKASKKGLNKKGDSPTVRSSSYSQFNLENS